MTKMTNDFTVTLRPETYQRLAELAALGSEDISDLADVIITDKLDEDDELDELQQQRMQDGVCVFCGEAGCRGECLGFPTPAPAFVKPPKE